MNDEIKEKMTIGKAKKILRGFLEKDCYYDTPLYYAIPYLLDYITNLQQKYDKALEDSVKETHKLMAIRKYLKDNERDYGSLEDNEKIILGIIEGKYNE